MQLQLITNSLCQAIILSKHKLLFHNSLYSSNTSNNKPLVPIFPVNKGIYIRFLTSQFTKIGALFWSTPVFIWRSWKATTYGRGLQNTLHIPSKQCYKGYRDLMFSCVFSSHVMKLWNSFKNSIINIHQCYSTILLIKLMNLFNIPPFSVLQ